ncbi:Metal-dependent hydrolase, endonuclease/exonuclease/phosphatase family [Mesobacillus persicus]|uniref:Metal-dependent hydrolase, endonuclease/exonuclease/phosphatase family n=1 Tax=Mesobacillus persicus TaxID=930146 RepID=A0A1H7W450_9BACI|nr:endonuclease/exonuclease/phosphatase family protein [Mesobacillus persicus]SEM16313.1 Metal-dependent hydrolase, endonuclease/exonuclease/phosphatase family [Mesobacillus persicus]
MNIKVMTYNIHHGKGTDKIVDLKRIADVITQSGAEIIGLNEVDKHFSNRSHFVDQIHFLAKELKLHYAFSPSLTLKTKNAKTIRQYGNGILSRYPIVSSHHHLLNFIPRLIEGRSILETVINVNGKLLNVYVTHLSLNPFLHKKQSGFLLKNTKELAIILGDWNMKPNTRKWKSVSEKYRDVWLESGKGAGFTYPSRKPRTRLDYIFTTKDFKVDKTEVLDAIPIASDHLPLLATLSI